MIYQYIAIHVSTGRRFRKQAEFLGALHFLKLLARWNYMADGSWIYYPADGIPGGEPIPAKNVQTFSEIVS